MFKKLWYTYIQETDENIFHWFNTETGEICNDFLHVLKSIKTDIKGMIKGHYKLGLYPIYWKYKKAGY